MPNCTCPETPRRRWVQVVTPEGLADANLDCEYHRGHVFSHHHNEWRWADPRKQQEWDKGLRFLTDPLQPLPFNVVDLTDGDPT